MALPIIGLISTVLFISAALLILLWKKDFEGVNQKIINRIGLAVLLIGIYSLLSIMHKAFFPVTELIPVISIVELAGFAVLMFGLFNFLEESK